MAGERTEPGARGRIRAVFFDLGGTLLRVKTSVGEIYAEAAARHGVELDASEVQARFSLAWTRSLERARARGHRATDSILKAEWLTIVRESLGSGVPAACLRPVFEELYAHFSSGRAWSVAPGARASLAHLRSRGLWLGVLSNWDSRFRATIEDLELDDAFDSFVVSHAVGFEKPHPEIFHAALRASRTRPEETLHVGDSLEADVRAARRVGIRTLWVAPVGDPYGCEAGAAVESLALSPDSWDRLLGGSSETSE
jgi:putative hydrolase of the HAD superfamily